MPFVAQTYRVMVGSPSDLSEERLTASEAVNEWNALHAADVGVVLLPVKWETHATPQAGIRPQEAINEQLVQKCDILIGMFWTKIGTSTGVAESGTIEEINQFVESDRPTLLYFSSRPIDPNKIDLKQHKKLKSFKSDTYSKALVAGFSTVAELRNQLLRHLTEVVRKVKPNSLNPMPVAQNAMQAVELPPQKRVRNYTNDDILSVLETWLGRNTISRNKEIMFFDDVDSELDLPSGSSKAHLEQAGKKYRYKVVRKTDISILFEELPPNIGAPRVYSYRH